ncbi:MAG: DUF3306 domain-containing protein [Burkholderiales bacterium]
MDDKETFLSRWSRRKLEANENPPALAPTELPAAGLAVPTAPPASAAEPAAPASPQGRSAEYRKFFDPQVDERLRQTALRGLFSDPHFNVMDGLDTYIDDYSLADPIPAAMLRQLNQAKNLFLFEDEEKTADGAIGPAAAGDTAVAAPAAPVDTSVLPEPSSAAGSDQNADVAAATAAVAAPVDGSRNN